MVRLKLTPAHNVTQYGNSELASVRWYASRVDGMKGDGKVTFQNIEGRVKEIEISLKGNTLPSFKESWFKECYKEDNI